MKYYVGIDLGGTNIAVGVVNEEFKIIGRSKLPTGASRPPEEICDDIANAVRMALQNAGISTEQVKSIGLGSPGVINSQDGIVEHAGNLNFYGVKLAEELKQRLGKDVHIENDANAAAYGEAIAGAAKGVKNVLMITLGTGVGSGIIIDGKIYSGAYFGGGEMGHSSMVYEGWSCTCGRKGCVEAYCSATGLIRLTKETMEKHRDSAMWQLCGSDINRASGRTSFEAMRAGDEAGKIVVDRYIDWLAYALAGYVNMLQPNILVLGGGVSHEGETILVPIRKKVREQCLDRYSAQHTQIVSAKLGNDAGIIGAAFLGV